MAEWLFWSQIAQGLGSILSVITSLFVAYFVYRYTKRKDLFDFTRQRWADQLAFNLAIMNSDEHLISFEKIVYGQDVEISADVARKRFNLFVKINMVQHHYFLYKSGLITRDVMMEEMRPIVRLIGRHKSDIYYLLEERGYSRDFVKVFRSLLHTVDYVNEPK